MLGLIISAARLRSFDLFPGFQTSHCCLVTLPMEAKPPKCFQEVRLKLHIQWETWRKILFISSTDSYQNTLATVLGDSKIAQSLN